MRLTIVLCASVATACASHVDLAIPPPSAPVEQRIAAYERLKGLSYDTRDVTTTTYTNGMAGASSTAHFTDDMHLANGTSVYFARDLLPVVPEGSPTARYANSAHSKRGVAIWLTVAAVASAVGGAFLAIVPIAAASNGNVNAVPIAFGVGIALGSLGLGIGAKVVGESGERDKARAFETYNASLLERLRLCSQGSMLTNCP